MRKSCICLFLMCFVFLAGCDRDFVVADTLDPALDNTLSDFIEIPRDEVIKIEYVKSYAGEDNVEAEAVLSGNGAKETAEKISHLRIDSKIKDGIDEISVHSSFKLEFKDGKTVTLRNQGLSIYIENGGYNTPAVMISADAYDLLKTRDTMETLVLPKETEFTYYKRVNGKREEAKFNENKSLAYVLDADSTNLPSYIEITN